MDVENTTPPFQLTDPRQIRIHERLGRLVGAGPAAFFFDACRLMEQTPSYQSTTHLVAHLLREIESALRDVLEPVSAQSQQAGSSGKSGHKDEIRRVLSALGISEDAPIAEKWLELAERSSEGALHRRAHRDSLARPRPVDEAFRQFWNDMQGVLEAVSARLELRFSEYRVLMDDLAAKDTPTAHDIDVFCKSVPNSVIAWSYFFHKISSPAWVEPLKKNAVFKQIPDLIRHENGISSPVWPAAEYLKKMAALVPDEVGKVLLEAPQTDNQRAVGDLAELACALPVTIAVEWTNGVIEWIKRQNFLSFGLPRTLGGLISNLAQRGQASAAIALAAALLDPAAHFDAWEYEQILSKNVPDLVAAFYRRHAKPSL